MDALDAAVNPRLDSLEEQVNALQSAQWKTSHRLSSVETRLGKVEDGVTALRNDVVELYAMVR